MRNQCNDLIEYIAIPLPKIDDKDTSPNDYWLKEVVLGMVTQDMTKVLTITEIEWVFWYLDEDKIDILELIKKMICCANM